MYGSLYRILHKLGWGTILAIRSILHNIRSLYSFGQFERSHRKPSLQDGLLRSFVPAGTRISASTSRAGLSYTKSSNNCFPARLCSLFCRMDTMGVRSPLSVGLVGRLRGGTERCILVGCLIVKRIGKLSLLISHVSWSTNVEVAVRLECRCHILWLGSRRECFIRLLFSNGFFCCLTTLIDLLFNSLRRQVRLPVSLIEVELWVYWLHAIGNHVKLRHYITAVLNQCRPSYLWPCRSLPDVHHTP